MPKQFAQRGPGDLSIRPVNTEAREHFEWGLTRFRDEARALIRLHHPNIVLTLRLFTAHGTAYIVMNYVEGASLKDLLSGGRTLPEPEIRALLDPLLDGLAAVHEAGYLHRDLKPGNIYVRTADRRPVILDFGAAREALGRETQTLSAIVSPGYSPPEQYGRGVKQKESADIYALAATLYRCVAGDAPPEAPDRVSAMVMGQDDPLLPAAEAGRGKYAPDLLRAIDQALSIRENERPQSIAAFRALVRGAAPAPRPQPKPTRLAPARAAEETLVAGPTGGADAAPAPAPQPAAPALRAARTPRWAVALGAAAFALAGAAIAYVTLQPGEQSGANTRAATDAAEEVRRRADEEAARRRREEGERAQAERKRREEAEEAERRRREESTRQSGSPGKPGSVFRDCPQCPQMVVLATSTFTMGTPEADSDGHADERPPRVVSIVRPFALGKYEVTFAEFDACVQDKGCSHRPEDNGRGRGLRPVVDVSWNDARAYVAWLSKRTGKIYRLPSEAEWEYAARAGAQTRFPWGNEMVYGRANCDGCGGFDHGPSVPVGKFPANAFGLHDMQGNVAEWTEDCWHANYVGAPFDASPWLHGGDCSLRVFRGGSWNAGPRASRPADRNENTTAFRGDFVGFRVAREL
jgi:formylglycine-generating enzyme required for sulfatase activity